MGQGRNYTTAIVAGVLAVCLFVLGVRWHVLSQRVPLNIAPAAASGSTSVHARPSSAADSPGNAAALPVDINTASARELELLPGIGEVLARRIIDFRKAHGPFKSLEGLLKVNGIGAKKLAALRGSAVCRSAEGGDGE